MAAKKKVVPRGAHEKIRDLASRGFPEKDISRALGVSQKTFARFKTEDPTVQDALDEGRSVVHQALFGKLYEKALNGELVPILFLLKAVFGYRENADVTQTNATQIVIQMPGAMDPASYAKLIASKDG